MSNNSANNKQSKKISTQLLIVILPMITIAIAIVTIFIAIRAKSVIEEEATNGLAQEAKSG